MILQWRKLFAATTKMAIKMSIFQVTRGKNTTAKIRIYPLVLSINIIDKLSVKHVLSEAQIQKLRKNDIGTKKATIFSRKSLTCFSRLYFILSLPIFLYLFANCDSAKIVWILVYDFCHVKMWCWAKWLFTTIKMNIWTGANSYSLDKRYLSGKSTFFDFQLHNIQEGTGLGWMFALYRLYIDRKKVVNCKIKLITPLLFAIKIK